MDLSHRLRSLQTRLRPFQKWFDSRTAQVIALALLLLAFFIVQRVVG